MPPRQPTTASGSRTPTDTAAIPRCSSWAGPTDKAEALVAYPNPAHGTVQVLNLVPGSSLTLFDALGRPVRTYVATEAPLDLSGIAAGLYWLRTPTQQVRLSVE